MTIAFYAPLKHVDHPVPSGDREMARAMVAAVERAGLEIEMVSTLRSFLARPDPDGMDALRSEAAQAIEVVATRWRKVQDRPVLWLTYHNYYKAPDLLGPALARRFGLPYVLAEASHAPHRAAGWGPWHAAATEASRTADMHICLTARDRAGLEPILAAGTPILELPPFLRARPWPAVDRAWGGNPVRLIAVAMMRPGDKLKSYRFLADALRLLQDVDWRLTLVGDGPARADVETAFAWCPQERLRWRGQLTENEVGAALREADLFTWPGWGEAFGIAYLEAQAAGLPVVALDVAGVSSVVRHGRTGVLVRTGEPEAYADALRHLVREHDERRRMSDAAVRFVQSERTVEGAAAILGGALTSLIGRTAATMP